MLWQTVGLCVTGSSKSMDVGGAIRQKMHGRWRSDMAKDAYVKEKDKIKRSVSLNLGI